MGHTTSVKNLLVSKMLGSPGCLVSYSSGPKHGPSYIEKQNTAHIHRTIATTNGKNHILRRDGVARMHVDRRGVAVSVVDGVRSRAELLLADRAGADVFVVVGVSMTSVQTRRRTDLRGLVTL